MAAGPRPGLVPLVCLFPWLWLAACAAPGELRVQPAAAAGAPAYVVSNGWHSEVVVETATLPVGAWPQREPFRDRRYIEVGWGDLDAYPADRLTVGLALKAAFVSRGSTLRVSGFDEPIVERFRGIEVVELRLSASALAALAGFIDATYAAGPDGRPIRLEPSGAGPPTFYLARGRFHALNTCNSWTARALQAAGLPIWPHLTFTAHQLMLQVVPLGRFVPTDGGLTVDRPHAPQG
jgi:uncharacterized protein (TIGR02117 family)